MGVEGVTSELALSCFLPLLPQPNTLHCHHMTESRKPAQPPAPAGRKGFLYTLTLPSPLLWPSPSTIVNSRMWAGRGRREKRKVLITRVKSSLPGMGVGEEKVGELMPACLYAWLPIQTRFPRPQRQNSLFPETGLYCRN